MFTNTAQRIIASGAWGAALVASVLLLAACGGGGGAGIAPVAPRSDEASSLEVGVVPFAYNNGAGVAGVQSAGFGAVRGADGKYVVQPMTATVRIVYLTVRYEFKVTIRNPITVDNNLAPVITLEGGEVVSQPPEQPTPPDVGDRPDEGGTTPPDDGEGAPPSPPAPPAEDPPPPPVNNDQPDEGGTTPPDDGESAPSPPNPAPPPAEDPGVPPDDDQEGGQTPPTPVNNEPVQLPQPGEFMLYYPPTATELFLSNDTKMTVTTGGFFEFVDVREDEEEYNRRTDATTTLQTRYNGAATGVVSVNAPGTIILTSRYDYETTITYGNSVYIMNGGYAPTPGYPAPGHTNVSVLSVGLGAVDQYVLTNGFAHGDGRFRYAAITLDYPTGFGWWGRTSFTASSPLEFFCTRGFFPVLRRLSNDPLLSCGGAPGTRIEHRPNKSDIASGALKDIGARGFAFADSPARFYVRWGNKEKRKQAGFSYNFDTFALRTDYNKLPAAQDSGVMLDTYRVGVMPDIGKRHRLFAGVDNYRNGILAIQYTDAADTDTHTNIYKLGSVAGKGGYAVKFEWRIVWE